MGSPSPWGQSLQGPPAHRDTVLGIPHAPATAQPLASPSHGDRALGVPHLTGHNPWCVPITPRDTAFGIPPPTGTELSVSRVTRGGMAYPTWPLASPVPPWGRSPHFPPWRQYCAPSMGTMVLGIPCPVGHSPWCLPSPRGTRPSPSPIPRGTATGVPPAMGTQPSVSPPRQGTQNLSTPLLQGARPHHLCALDELLGSGGGVVPLPAPGAERRRLQRPPVGEGEGPWPHQRARVDGVEVDGSLLLALTPGQEGDTWRERDYGTGTSTGHPPPGPRHVPVLVPGTAGGTVRRRAVTVAMAISSGLYLVGQECPGVTMLGFSRVPSR